ncbi:Diacylglycerol kinase [Entamoeba marina]
MADSTFKLKSYTSQLDSSLDVTPFCLCEVLKESNEGVEIDSVLYYVLNKCKSTLVPILSLIAFVAFCFFLIIPVDKDVFDFIGVCQQTVYILFNIIIYTISGILCSGISQFLGIIDGLWVFLQNEMFSNVSDSTMVVVMKLFSELAIYIPFVAFPLVTFVTLLIFKGYSYKKLKTFVVENPRLVTYKIAPMTLFLVVIYFMPMGLLTNQFDEPQIPFLRCFESFYYNMSSSSQSDTSSDFEVKTNNITENDHNLCDVNLKVIPHNFEYSDKQSSNVCDYCRSPLNGRVLECSQCHCVCHDYCVYNVLSNCMEMNGVKSQPHTFSKITTKGFCHVCRKNYHELLVCSRCGQMVHKTCKEFLQNCRSLSVETTERLHYYIPGGKGNCVACKKPTGSTSQLIDFTCLYCGESIHSSCIHNHSLVCSCGILSQYMVHPKNILLTPTPVVEPYDGMTPFIFVINELSGGQEAIKVRLLLESYLHPYQFFNIKTLEEALPMYKLFDTLVQKPIVVICGGDGSVEGPVEHFGRFCEYIIFPFGTGNDLSQSLGRVASKTLDELFSNPIQTLHKYVHGKKQIVDRWTVNKATYPGDPTFTQFRHFTNYISFGADAAVALSFDDRRFSGPCGRIANRVKYAMSATALLDDWFKNINEKIIVEVDGKELDLPQLDCIVFISSYTCYGGHKLWNDKTQRMDDGVIEIVGVSSISDLASVSVGLKAPMKIGQGKDIVVTLKPGIKLPCQTDGEPFVLDNCVLHFYTETQLCFYSQN